MPRYVYKCLMCSEKEIVELPISFDPAKHLDCPSCSGGLLERRIGMRPDFVPRTTEYLGDWYKKKTGEELLGG